MAAKRDCGSEKLWHSPYSSNRAPCDFHLIPCFKGHLQGKHFENDNEFKTATQDWLKGQDKTLYLSDIGKLSDRYNRCIIAVADPVGYSFPDIHSVILDLDHRPVDSTPIQPPHFIFF